jgi:hypothetical protein
MEKLTVTQPVKAFPEVHCCVNNSQPIRWILFTTSHPISLRSILILSSHLFLRLPIGFFPSDFPTKISYAFLMFPMRATCPARVILLYQILSYKIYSSDTRSVECGCFCVSARYVKAVPVREGHSIFWLTYANVRSCNWISNHGNTNIKMQ